MELQIYVSPIKSTSLHSDGTRRREEEGREVPVVAQRVKKPNIMSMRRWVQSLASLSGLRIQHCCELQCNLQMQLGLSVAMAMA